MPNLQGPVLGLIQPQWALRLLNRGGFIVGATADSTLFPVNARVLSAGYDAAKGAILSLPAGPQFIAGAVISIFNATVMIYQSRELRPARSDATPAATPGDDMLVMLSPRTENANIAMTTIMGLVVTHPHYNVGHPAFKRPAGRS